MKRRVWIDTDMGFDDLAAILTVVGDPAVEVGGISLAAGNAPLVTVADNAARAAALFGWRFPIHLGRSAPLLGPQIGAAYVLGETGMRSAGRMLPPAPARFSSVGAFDALTAFLDGASADILALGPLTNLAALLAARPERARQIGGIVWMGGSAGPGNHSAAAEFNAFADPEAVAIVIGSGVPFRMVGLDCCRQVTTTAADAAPLRATGTERGLILADLLEGYAGIASSNGARAMALYDPTAAAAFLDPLAIAFAPAHIAVERGGNAGRGATFVERRVPQRAVANAEIAVTADAERIRRRVLEALRRAAREDGP